MAEQARKLLENPDALYNLLHQALRAYHKLGNTPENVLEGLMLARVERARQSEADTPAAQRHAANAVLLDGLDELARKDEEGAGILQARFLDRQQTRQVAYEKNLSVDSINRLQRRAIAALAEIIWSREQACRADQAKRYTARLRPASYATLFGLEDLSRLIARQLMSPDEPGLHLLVGIGGIGKTALADQVVRRCIRQFAFDEVAAVYVDPPPLRDQARPPSHTFEQIVVGLYNALPDMPPLATGQARRARLGRALKARRHLVWIDNLEEAADVAYLLEHLGEWVGPSQFILTSRAQPLISTAARVHSLTQLSPSHSLALMRFEAGRRGVDDLVNASDETLLSVYEITGGNPLALKLTTGLAAVVPLPVILSDLRRGLTDSTQSLYRRIYLRAWQALSESAKDLLEAMPLISQAGGTPDELRTYANLGEAALWQAIHELSARSLLEVHGTLHEKRYGIHQLTRTFLHTDIIRWAEGQQ